MEYINGNYNDDDEHNSNDDDDDDSKNNSSLITRRTVTTTTINVIIIIITITTFTMSSRYTLKIISTLEYPSTCLFIRLPIYVKPSEGQLWNPSQKTQL